ncbi:Hypothetical protein CM240_0854 [Clostridium bornimense]|uniref:Flavodoxin domain-containing protein n=1 Tax=Clostridium bornimense TaxID=1216932 RepID=W6RUN9_9CLOT|nr:flavodoxin domain-containing protein [Clostridium bornimense]CDM68018.1 Hypothetical protein CM240_0854 [Clostridium bornimense]
MKSIVIYKSSTGFTKQYAEWIAEEMGIKAIDINKVSTINISDYEYVIFGGWIMASNISGLDKIKQLKPKKLVVFAVGSSLYSEELKNQILKQNNIEEKSFFYMPGGIRFEKLNFIVRFMLKKIRKSVAKKENKSEQEAVSSFDISDKKYITPLINYFDKK